MHLLNNFNDFLYSTYHSQETFKLYKIFENDKTADKVSQMYANVHVDYK